VKKRTTTTKVAAKKVRKTQTLLSPKTEKQNSKGVSITNINIEQTYKNNF